MICLHKFRIFYSLIINNQLRSLYPAPDWSTSRHLLWPLGSSASVLGCPPTEALSCAPCLPGRWITRPFLWAISTVSARTQRPRYTFLSFGNSLPSERPVGISFCSAVLQALKFHCLIGHIDHQIGLDGVTWLLFSKSPDPVSAQLSSCLIALKGPSWCLHHSSRHTHHWFLSALSSKFLNP